jgi:TRAP-type mannitol/chloroaromatic compound transport system permease large subunit
MIPLEWMPPLMFSGLILIMLIGYPVAFSLAALGFIFGFIAIGTASSSSRSCRRSRAGSSARC